MRGYEHLFDHPNVVTVGRGFKSTGGRKTDEKAIVCGVTRKKARAALSKAEIIPQEIDGLKTDVIQVGKIVALESGYEKRIRPVPLGYSIGHYAITAGTLGCYVRIDDQLYILSNNHVMANSNGAILGDKILQPGPYDGGVEADTVARLAEFVPIQFIGDAETGCTLSNTLVTIFNALAGLLGRKTRVKAYVPSIPINYVDAALADLTADELASLVGNPVQLLPAELGLPVQKTGRTTGFTQGQIDQVDVSTQVSYGTGKIALFQDQILIEGNFSAGGDSGSAIVTPERDLVGLLFAGGEGVTIANRIENVAAAFGGFAEAYLVQ